MSTLILEKQGPVARITINRAEKRNAFTQSMWQELATHCDNLHKDPQPPKVLIIQAAGDKAFCAGADIEELTRLIKDPLQLKLNNQIVQSAQQKLHQLPFATIAKINGACVGGGMGISLACDFRVAVEEAKFAITPSKLGLLYSIEDTRRLVNIVGEARAKNLLYLGQSIDAFKAFSWGMLTELTEAAELDAAVDKLVEQLLAVSSTSIRGVKETIGFLNHSNEFTEEDIRKTFDRAFYQDDFKEGAKAFLEKRPAKFN